ncbi:MAG: bacteriohemerythrin [Proteobacteria bacterium]|nr:bacteriohemerythrin [Pseudomonadota bacterium]MBU1686124.1 bacteriohemerythrin [Pseudomonadota bacterium]
MQNIVEFSRKLVTETALINGFQESDWTTLQEVKNTTIAWGNEFSGLFTEALYAHPETTKILAQVNRTDHRQSFAVWYETLVSGNPGTSFWPETCLIGLYHATSGVDNRHVIAMCGRLEAEFLRKCLDHFDQIKANELYLAFKRILGIALAIMVDSYHFATLIGLQNVGVNEALFKRIQGLSIRKIIEETRSVLPLIEWNDSLSVNIASIDSQHKKLVEILNSLHDSSASSQGSEVMGKALTELVEYTLYHFKFEEELMRKHDYPDIVGHLAAHQDLVAQVGKFHEDYHAGRAKISGELFKFLRSWLNGHIRGTDKRYSAHLRQCGVD